MVVLIILGIIFIGGILLFIIGTNNNSVPICVTGIWVSIFIGVIEIVSLIEYNKADIRARIINNNNLQNHSGMIRVTTDDCFYSWSTVKEELKTKDVGEK